MYLLFISNFKIPYTPVVFIWKVEYRDLIKCLWSYMIQEPYKGLNQLILFHGPWDVQYFVIFISCNYVTEYGY